MPSVKHDGDGKPTTIWLGSDEDVPTVKAPSGVWLVTSDSPIEDDKPMGISVVITHTSLGWSISVKSGDSHVYESMPEARDAVRAWLRHWADSDIEVAEVRNFHSPDRFIPKDGSVPGG